MIALIIIGMLLLIITAILFLPIDAVIKFKEELFLKVKFSGLRVYRLKQDEEEVTTHQKTEQSKKADSEPKNENLAVSYFKKLKDKYGFSGAVRQLLGFARDLLPHIRKLLKHIKFKRVIFDIVIAEDDAAKTAIEYGRICAVAYPLLSALEAIANIKYKAINITSDFGSKNSEFSFEGIIRTRIIFLLIALIKVYSEYKKFTVRIENDERK